MKKNEPILIDMSGASSGHRPLDSLQQEYLFLAEQTRQGVWRLDAHGRIIEVNSQMAKWLDTVPSLLIGRRATEFLVTRDARRSPRLMRSGRFDAEFRTATRIDRLAEVHSLLLRNEHGAVIGALQLINDRTVSAVIEERLVNEVQRMAKLAGEDVVTELPNRRSFEIVLEDHIRGAASSPFGLLVIDLDQFKEINDEFGHAVGDEALVQFAKHLRSLLRETDYVARLGGDEFAAILSDVDEASVMQTVRRLRSSIRMSLPVGEETIELQASIGHAHSSKHLEEVVLRADRVMYADKQRRRIARQKLAQAGNPRQSSA